MRTEIVLMVVACSWQSAWGHLVGPHDARLAPSVECSADTTPTHPGGPGTVSCLANNPSPQPFAWQQLPGGLAPIPLYLTQHRHFSRGDTVGCSVQSDYGTRTGDHGTLKCSAVAHKHLPPAGDVVVPPPVVLPSAWPWDACNFWQYRGLPLLPQSYIPAPIFPSAAWTGLPLLC